MPTMTDAPKPHDAADLVERLRESTLYCSHGWWSRLPGEAADALERLAAVRADNERLFAFVKQIAAMPTDTDLDGDMSGDDAASELSQLIEMARTIEREAQKKEAA